VRVAPAAFAISLFDGTDRSVRGTVHEVADEFGSRADRARLLEGLIRLLSDSLLRVSCSAGSAQKAFVPPPEKQMRVLQNPNLPRVIMVAAFLESKVAKKPFLLSAPQDAACGHA